MFNYYPDTLYSQNALQFNDIYARYITRPIRFLCSASSDELPVQLTLPRAMREAKNRQQLSSLALLGQEFWRYPMANPKPPESGSSNTSSLSSFHGGE